MDYIRAFDEKLQESMWTMNREKAVINALEYVGKKASEKQVDIDLDLRGIIEYEKEVSDFISYFSERYFDEATAQELNNMWEKTGDMPVMFRILNNIMDFADMLELEGLWLGLQQDKRKMVAAYVDAIAEEKCDRMLAIYYDGSGDLLQLGADMDADIRHRIETHLGKAQKYGAEILYWRWRNGVRSLSVLRASGGKFETLNVEQTKRVYHEKLKAGIITDDVEPVFGDFMRLTMG